MIKAVYDLLIQKSVQISATLLLFLSLFIFLQNDHPSVRKLQTDMADLLLPLKEPAIWFSRQVQASEENKDLTRRIIEMSTEYSRFSLLLEENRRLRAMLDFRERSPFTMIPGLVISSGLQHNLNGILINRGSADSVQINDPIVNVDGVVGKIHEVGIHSSIGQIIAEPNARISVAVRPSNARGILQWYGGNRFIIKGIPSTMAVEKKNLVVSSGFSDIYPPDLPVGVVEDTQAAPDGFTTTVYGRLIVDFNRLEEVFIVLRADDIPEISGARGAER